MRNLFELSKISAKAIFIELRKNSPIDCEILKQKIKVSNKFYSHIIYHKKHDRPVKEVIQRILIIPLIPEILRKGKLIELRKKSKKQYFEILLKKKDQKLSVIIEKNKNGYVIFSCFQKYSDEKKKDLAAPTMGTSSHNANTKS